MADMHTEQRIGYAAKSSEALRSAAPTPSTAAAQRTLLGGRARGQVTNWRKARCAPRRSRYLGSILTILSGLMGACGSSSEPRTALDDVRLLPDDSVDYGPLYRFLPLYNNTVYSYQTLNEESGETGLFVIRVHHLPSGLVEFNVGGRQQWLELTEDAVRQTSGGSLLRMPLIVGKTWKGHSGIVTLTAVGRRVDVPAGSYRNCIVTTEDSTVGDTSQRVITSYCPDVGVARLEIESTVSNTYRRDVAELSSFGPMIDWGKNGVNVTK